MHSSVTVRDKISIEVKFVKDSVVCIQFRLCIYNRQGSRIASTSLLISNVIITVLHILNCCASIMSRTCGVLHAWGAMFGIENNIVGPEEPRPKDTMV
jgi:hypothetical protein